MIGNRFWRRAVGAVLAVVLTATLPLSVFAAYENTYVNTGNQAVDLLGVAATQVGYAEGANNANKYAESYGNANQPWCGFFISWCARQANIPTAVIPDTGMSSIFKNIGTYHARSSGYIPQPGDILMYDYDADGSADHVSIVEKYTASDKKVTVIDGNWSDKVSRHTASMTDSDVMGFTTPTYTTKITELVAINLVKPSIILKGKSFSVSGMLYSNTNITSVSLSVQDAEGKTKIHATAAPNAKEYDLKGLDSQVKFGTLAEGEYSFMISATDKSGDTKRWVNTFEVVTTVPMTVASVVAPRVLTVEQKFSISGTVSCIENLSTVSVGIYDEKGTYKTGATANPNTTSYNIKGIDNYVSFGSLTKGYYTMRISARSANGSAQWEYPFTVGITPAFTVADVKTPEMLVPGESFAVSGVVTCTTPIEAVSVMILDENKNRLQTITEKMQAYSFDVSAAAQKLVFTTLPEGSYYVRIGAASGGTVNEWFYPFVVSEPYNFAYNGCAYPTVLVVGENFTVDGVVSCSQPLEAVSIMILDADKNRLQTVTKKFSANTFDLSASASSLKFDGLATGSYYFRIGASSEGVLNEWFFSFRVIEAPTANVAGDVTLDGDVNMRDVMTMYSHVSGANVMSTSQLERVGTTAVSMTTTLRLFRYVSGLSDTYL